ncbi:hypothetical protein BVY01_04380 [bacterium I07]|nr:hypothetical protein BVY01_04380 [bacterium I07]
MRKAVFIFFLMTMMFGPGSEVSKCQNRPAADSTKSVSPAAESPWKRSLVAGLNLSQTAFSNWAKGGQNSFTWSVRLDADAMRSGVKWDLSFTNDLLIGQTKIEGHSPRTSLDKIDLDATAAYKFSNFVNPYISAGLRSQCSKGYDNK